MTDSAELIVSRRPGVLTVCVNRPRVHNALSRAVLGGIGEALEQNRLDAHLACVVIRSVGPRYFAAGGDIADLDASRSPQQTRPMLAAMSAVLDVVRDFPVPVVARLDGDAIGGGAELAMACDFRVMRDDASIGYIHSRLHITAAWGGATDLVDRLGASRALRMMARSEMISASLALQWGIADVVAPAAGLDVALDEFIAPLLAADPQVLRSQTAFIRAAQRGANRAELRAREARDIARHWDSEAHWATVDRFLGRTQPVDRKTPGKV